MTGIAAIFSRGPANERRLGAMMDGMADRAHDGTGCWVRGRFALGACILHTTTESLEAGQPHTNEDESLALVMDGYLTNWEELRRDLTERGARLRNRSDAELILRAYEQWGEECAERIEGEFAFVIADTRLHRIFAARNPQGTKPLFYHASDEALILASDMKAVLGGLERLPEPNHDYLVAYSALQFNLPEETVWQGVMRLLQAHCLVADQAGLRIRRYYDLPLSERIRYKSDEEYAEHYREVLFDAVRRCSRSHLTAAFAVSGGLDSSAVYCIAHKLEAEGRLLAPGMQGYSLAAEPDSEAYELPYARAAAAHVGRQLVEVPLFKPPLDWYTQQAKADGDVPNTTNGAMMIGLEKRVHADGSRVYLTGEGGDEWLQGNNFYYSEFLQEAEFGRFWAAMREEARASGWVRAAHIALRVGLSTRTPHRLRMIRRQWLRRREYGPKGGLFWLKPEARAILERQAARYQESLPSDPRATMKVHLFNSPRSACGRAVMERQGGRNGIEYRYPMLTPQFIAFSLATPEHVRRRGGLTKVIHRLAMQQILPREIIDRLTKAHFESDFTDREMADFCAGAGRLYLQDYHDPSGLERVIAAVRASKLDADYSWEIYGCYAVAAFLMNFGDLSKGPDQSWS